jgi:hypothetical protein
MVGIVITQARHTAKIRAKTWYFTAYRRLKGCVKLNSFQAIAPLMGQKKGSFLRGHISLKMGCFAPFLATIQALSRTRVFLYT